MEAPLNSEHVSLLTQPDTRQDSSGSAPRHHPAASVPIRPVAVNSTWFPLCSDSIGNNIRSRLVVALVFSFIAACLVLMLWEQESGVGVDTGLSAHALLEGGAVLLILAASPVFVAMVPRPGAIVQSISGAMLLAVLGMVGYFISRIVAHKGELRLDVDVVLVIMFLFVSSAAAISGLFVLIGSWFGERRGMYTLRCFNDEQKALDIHLYTWWILRKHRHFKTDSSEGSEVEPFSPTASSRTARGGTPVIPCEYRAARTPAYFIISTSVSITLIVAFVLYSWEVSQAMKRAFQRQIDSLNCASYAASSRPPVCNAFEGMAENVDVAWITGIAVATTAILLNLLWTHAVIPSMITKLRRGTLHKRNMQEVNYRVAETFAGLHVVLVMIAFVVIFFIVFLVVVLAGIPGLASYVEEELVALAISSISWFVQFLVGFLFVRCCFTEGSFIIRRELYSIYHMITLVLSIFAGVTKSLLRWLLCQLSILLMFPRVDIPLIPGCLSVVDMPHNAFMSVIGAEAVNGNPIMLVFCSHLLRELALRATADSLDFTSTFDMERPPVMSLAMAQDGDEEERDTRRAHSLHPDSFGREQYSRMCSRPALCNSVANLSRLQLRFECRPVNGTSHRKPQRSEESGRYEPELDNADLPLDTPPVCGVVNLERYRSGTRAIHERICNRWWLLVVLTRNPSLTAMRKHRLGVPEAVNGSATEVV